MQWMEGGFGTRERYKVCWKRGGVWKCKESLFYGFIYSDAEIQMIPTHLLAGAAQK